jgi:hypothetical protein
MSQLQTIPSDFKTKLTPRQRQVYRLRHLSGATIPQIANWLKISQRAVFYRLESAHRRLGGPAPVQDEPGGTGRIYAVSQIQVGTRSDSLNIDEL